MALLDENYLEESKKSFYNAFQLDSKFFKALLKIGEILLKQDRCEEAMVYFDEMLKSEPNNELALTRKGDTFYLSSKVPEALTFYQKALSVNPNNEDALLGMGLCKHSTKELDEAINYYDKALNVDADNTNAMYNKAVALLAKGESKHVGELLKKAKNIDDSPYILYACGLNYLREKKYDLANEMFDACIAKNLRAPEVFLSKAQALYGNANYEEALRYVDEVIKSKDNYFNAWNTRANILDKLGKKDEALNWYKAAADSKPENALYLINYCVALLENGYNDKCKELLAYVETFYKSQRPLFNEQEFEFIEKCIKNIHDKFDNSNKNAKVVRLAPTT
jgi:tetratricopeptide (TPR) repeat protein